jgi:hypothetical protein
MSFSLKGVFMTTMFSTRSEWPDSVTLFNNFLNTIDRYSTKDTAGYMNFYFVLSRVAILVNSVAAAVLSFGIAFSYISYGIFNGALELYNCRCFKQSLWVFCQSARKGVFFLVALVVLLLVGVLGVVSPQIACYLLKNLRKNSCLEAGKLVDKGVETLHSTAKNFGAASPAAGYLSSLNSIEEVLLSVSGSDSVGFGSLFMDTPIGKKSPSTASLEDSIIRNDYFPSENLY